MKTKHDYQLEFEAELASIEEQIDEMRAERRHEEIARYLKKRFPLTSGSLLLPDDD